MTFTSAKTKSARDQAVKRRSGLRRSTLWPLRYSQFWAGGSPGRRAITSRRENKTPESNPDRLGRSWAPAFNALASCDIQDDGLLAVSAIDRKVLSHRVIRDAEQVAVPSTDRTDDPSILHVDFITLHAIGQPLFKNVSYFTLHFKIVSRAHARVFNVYHQSNSHNSRPQSHSPYCSDGTKGLSWGYRSGWSCPSRPQAATLGH